MPTYRRLGRVETYIRYTGLDGTENRPIRFAAPNARLAWVERQGEVHVLFYNKHLLCFNRDQICIRSNDAHRFYTKVRLNQASNQFGLGFKVYQRGEDWFVEWRGETLTFRDGLVLNRRAPMSDDVRRVTHARIDQARGDMQRLQSRVTASRHRRTAAADAAVEDGQGPEN